MSALQKLLTVTVSLCIGLVLALALGEVVMRVRTPPGMRLQNHHILLPKNQVYIYGNTGLRGCDPRIVHHKNSLGFRGPELPADWISAESVIAVGGSTTECFYLSDGHSWPEIVEHNLRADIPNLWINNAGLDGHSTFGHTILVRDVLVNLHPKTLLFLVGINDVGRDDLISFDKNLLMENAPRSKRLLVALSEHSKIIAWLENFARAVSARRKGLSHHALDLEKLPMLSVTEADTQRLLQKHKVNYIAPYKARLRALMKLCKDAGIQPVLITQPALYGKGKDDATGIDLESVQVEKDENGRIAWQVLELYNSATRAVAHDAGIALIDLAQELPKTSRSFYDFYHFTNAGSETVALIVAKHLKPLLTNHKVQ